MASDPEDSERTRAAAWESICGAVMLIGGYLLSTLDDFASWVGLALMIMGIGGLGHGVLYGLGLAQLPGPADKSVERKDDDARH